MNVMLKWSKSIYFWLIVTFLILMAISSYNAYNNGYKQGYASNSRIDTVAVETVDTNWVHDTIYVKAKTNLPPDTNTAEAMLELPRNGRIRVGFQVPEEYGIPKGSFFYFPEIRLPDPQQTTQIIHRTDTLNIGNSCLARSKDAGYGALATLIIIAGGIIYFTLQ